jgi:hypothetical protein
MLGSKGCFNFAGIIPFIAHFFGLKDNAGAGYLDSPSKGTVFAHGSHSHYGSSGMNYSEIMQARRRTRRAKAFKQYRGCNLRGQRVY